MTDSVAYFSMEIGIKPEIKSYSGGLGVLAGDTLKSAADQGLDYTGVTLMYGNGYFCQVLDEEGYQSERPQNWDYQDILDDTGKKVDVEVKGESVTLKIWSYEIEGERGTTEVYFLDSNLEENSEEAKDYTRQLYDAGDEIRLCQEVILGIGGVKALEELGISPSYFHMNEGHSALLTLEAEGDFLFTTHTPVAAGHDEFNMNLVREVLGERASELDFDERLNMTELALRHSDFQNAVSRKHKDVSEEMFVDYDFCYVTNGVHASTWTSEPVKELFDRHVEDWRIDSERLTQAKKIPDRELWKAKEDCKRELKELIEDNPGKSFDVNKFTVGFARRSTGYKRPDLIFRDLNSLEKLGKKYEGFQLVFAGKAHPDDTNGKEIIKKIKNYGDMLENVEVYFIEDYGMGDAKKLISGSDIWLNNPVRGQEASGTSGMKAALNGTPQLSVLDGWWIEGHIEDVTGWSIGEEYVEGEDQDKIDSESIYRKLDHILSIYQNERKEWIAVMKNCISVNGAYFNTDRMLKEYVIKACM